MNNVCLDKVYLNYLEEKIKIKDKEKEKEKDKKSKKSNKGAKKGSKNSMKPVPKTFVDDESFLDSKTRRQHSSPNLTRAATKDDSQLDAVRPTTKVRRGSVDPGGRISPRPPVDKAAGKTSLTEIHENVNVGNERSPKREIKHTNDDKPRQENREGEEKDSNINGNDNKIPKATDTQVNEKELMLNLIKKNIAKSQGTASDENALYVAYDLLMEEYRSRKSRRIKMGGLFRKKAKKIRSLLIQARRFESDLQLKARSQDLQTSKSKSKGRRYRVNYENPDKI